MFGLLDPCIRSEDVHAKNKSCCTANMQSPASHFYWEQQYAKSRRDTAQLICRHAWRELATELCPHGYPATSRIRLLKGHQVEVQTQDHSLEHPSTEGARMQRSFDCTTNLSNVVLIPCATHEAGVEPAAITLHPPHNLTHKRMRLWTDRISRPALPQRLGCRKHVRGSEILPIIKQDILF
jgi:hypothetical protein